jgi:DNA-binding NarL/FixJ family response regulator
LLLVDDHEVIRAGLRAVLSKCPNLEIVGEAGSVADAVRETVRLKPDVVLMDVRMPDGTGFEACREIHRLNVDSRVLFLTSYGDDEVVMQSLMAEGDGFLLKDVRPADLLVAIEKVHAGQSILDPAVTRPIFEQLKRNAAFSSQGKLDQLSAQEKRILALVAEGQTNKEIGVSMGLSDKTVKNYLANAMEKLQMNRRAQVAAFYVQQTGKS